MDGRVLGYRKGEESMKGVGYGVRRVGGVVLSLSGSTSSSLEYRERRIKASMNKM